MTARPHDALFKAAFEHPAHAAGLFRHLLPPSICAAVVWESAAQEPGSFIDPELADHHSDLLFSVRLHSGEPALMYLLLEHQSRNDPDMPLRMATYLLRIWERFRAEHGNARLPVVLPVVLSHVPGGWSAPRRFEELFDAEVMSLAGIAELTPHFSLLVDDLAHLSNEDLKARALAAFPTLVLWALRDARDVDQLLANLSHWAAAFAEARRASDGIRSLAQLFRYFALVTDQLRYQEFRAKLHATTPEAEEIAMTMAEELHQQGMAQGRVEGQAEGRVEGRVEGQAEGRRTTLRKLLTLKFGAIGPEQAVRIEAAGLDELDRYLERVLTAETLAVVFAE